jgi:hypothetical protein
LPPTQLRKRSIKLSRNTARSAPSLDQGIQQQAEFDVESLVQAGRKLSKSEREEIKQVVLIGMRWTYLGTRMTHPNFLETVESIKPEARQQIE